MTENSSPGHPTTPRRGRSFWIAVVLATAGGIASLAMAAAAETPDAPPRLVAPDSGYVITSDAVIRNCGACHTRDDAGRMGRISYMRKTPEGWQNSIRRMVSLHGVPLEPAAAREVVRYLANMQGLAPEELEAGRFEVEQRLEPYTYEADRATERTCIACHSMGRVITQRRTPEEWRLLMATHRALYPLIDTQVFYSGGDDESDEEFPVDHAVAHLSEAFPLSTPEWEAWSANVRPARVAGTWALAGDEPGRGKLYGTMTVAAVPGTADEFTTTIRYRYAGEDREVTAAGNGLVYTGFQWRGRSEIPGAPEPVRQVMSVERGWNEMTGRWFHGAHEEFGIDVTARRADGVVISGVHPAAIRAGAGVQEVTVYGANLPASLAPSAVDLGPGIVVREVVRAGPEAVVLRVEPEAAAQIGVRDVFVAGAFLTDGVALYDSVDAIRVTPELGMARIGGVIAPKMFQQFEATAFDHGVDGEAGTEDDIEIGVVPAVWSLDEYPTTYDDDDLSFVGGIDSSGLFTPAPDGPNPDRRGNRNNMGEIWAVARYQDPVSGTTVDDRAYLIVTAPVYLRWDEWEQQP